MLANAAVTCTDGMVTGNVGVKLPAPIGSITQTSCPISGNKNVGDAAAVAAYNDFLIKYAALKPTSQDICTETLTGTLAGRTLTPGTYCFDAAAALTGILTLQGPADGMWTFKIGTHAVGALAGTNFTVVLNGGAPQCNVTWWVDAAATMTDSHLIGTVLAGAGITLIRGIFDGNAWAGASGVGDVTITNTGVTGCRPGTGTGGGTGGGTITNPPPLQHGYLTVCKDTPAGTTGRFQIDAWIRFDNGTDHTVGTYINSGECKPLFVSLPDPIIQVLENLGNGDPGWHLASITRITDAGTDEVSGNNIGTKANPIVCSIDFTHGCVLIFHNARN